MTTELSLIGVRPACFGRDDPVPDFLEAAPSHLPLDGGGIQAVEMHVDSIQPRAFQRRPKLGEQDRVGGQGQAVHSGHAREPLDDLDEVEPQGRLAAGQPEFSKAHADGGARDGFELRRGQQLVFGKKAQSLQRHAVNASQVACVDYR